MIRGLARVFLGLLAAVSVGLSVPQVTHAASSDSGAAQAVPLSVLPVQNEYQVNKATTFYDLEMKPGQSTNVRMKLGNKGSTPLKVKVLAISASTSDKSQAVYVPQSKSEYDPTLKYPLNTLIKIPTKYTVITIPAGGTAEYIMPLTMPAQKLKGIILGGIQITPAKVKKAKAGVTSTYTYTVAMRLSNGIDQLPDLRLNSVKLNRENTGTVTVDAKMQNYKAAMLRKGTETAKVTKQGQNRVLKSVTYNSTSAAPNSNWRVQVPWSGAIAPGDYTLHLTYRSDDPQFDSTKVWHFSRNFHVSAVEAARYTLANLQIPWWVYVILLLILLLLIVVIWLLVKRRKEAKPHEDQKHD